MGNVLTVEAAAPTVLASAVIAITVFLRWRKREVRRPSQDNTATGNASMTNSQSTYSGLIHSVINNYYGIATVSQSPSDTRGTTSGLLSTATNLSLPPQEQDAVLDVTAETTSRLPSGSESTAQVHYQSQLPSAPSKPQSPPLGLPPPETTPAPQVVKGIYWYPNYGIAVEDIDATLYTHILCFSAELDP